MDGLPATCRHPSRPISHASRTAHSLSEAVASTTRRVINASSEQERGDACVTRHATLVSPPLRSSRPPGARSACIVSADVRLSPCSFSICVCVCVCVASFSVFVSVTLNPSCAPPAPPATRSLSLAVPSLSISPINFGLSIVFLKILNHGHQYKVSLEFFFHEAVSDPGPWTGMSRCSCLS